MEKKLCPIRNNTEGLSSACSGYLCAWWREANDGNGNCIVHMIGEGIWRSIPKDSKIIT